MSWNGPCLSATKDGHFWPIPGSETLAFSLRHLKKASREKLEAWAGSEPAGDPAGHDGHERVDDSGEGDEETEDLSDVFRELKSQRNNENNPADDDDSDSQDDDGPAFEEFLGLMEEYEANHVSFLSDSEVARAVGSQEYHAADECNGNDLDDAWTCEQREETLEIERARRERDLVQGALLGGFKVEGQHFLDIASSEMVEPWQQGGVSFPMASVGISELNVICNMHARFCICKKEF